MASGSKSVDDRSNWHAVNMVPMNPHCTHSPEKARTPSPRNFFSYHFPDAGVYRKLYAAIRQGKNPWMKNNDDDEKIETESPPKTPGLPTNDEIDHQPVMMDQKGGDVESIASSSPMATPVQVRDVADSVVSVHTLDATPVEADADAGHGTGPRVAKQFVYETPPRPTKRGCNTPISMDYSSNTSCTSKAMSHNQKVELGKSGYRRGITDGDEIIITPPPVSWEQVVQDGARFKDDDGDKSPESTMAHPFFKKRRTNPTL